MDFHKLYTKFRRTTAASGDGGVAEESLWIAHGGAIRDDQAHIEMTGPVLAAGQRLLVRGTAPAATRDAVPKVFARDVERGGGDGLILYQLVAPLAALPVPLVRVDVAIVGATGEILAEFGENYALSHLFPSSERDFVARFTWEGQRIQDGETLRFAAAQVMDHADYAVSRIVAAAAIVAYRSLDAKDVAQCEDALRRIDRAIARLPELSITNHVRTDRDHMSVSLNVIRWHLCLALGQFDEVMRTLRQGYEILQPIEDAWSVGYNGAKTLLFYGFMLWRSGREQEAAEVFDFAFVLFQRVAASATKDNATLFNDHRVAHRAAFLGMVGKENMMGRPSTRNTRLDTKTLGGEIFRVRDPRALKQLRGRLEEMVQVMEGQRGDSGRREAKAGESGAPERAGTRIR